MTDTEMQRRKAICDVAGVDDIGELSDGFHTFNSLYEQRMILFAALVKAYKDKAWKSYRHEDGEYCFGGGWFIVGIDTPEGSYTYHYENKYWDMFDCVDLPRAKHWDGHTEADAETRLMSLDPDCNISSDGTLTVTVPKGTHVGRVLVQEDGTQYGGLFYPDEDRKRGKWINGKCSACGEHAPFYAMASTYCESKFCPNCGADMRRGQKGGENDA